MSYWINWFYKACMQIRASGIAHPRLRAVSSAWRGNSCIICPFRAQVFVFVYTSGILRKLWPENIIPMHRLGIMIVRIPIAGCKFGIKRRGNSCIICPFRAQVFVFVYNPRLSARVLFLGL